MRTVYVVDDRRVFTGEVKQIELSTPIKKNWLLDAPPAGPGYHIWDGFKWFTRTEYPHPSAPPPSVMMTPVEFLRMFTATERKTLRTAAKTDDTLDDAFYLFESARDIDLYDEDTQNFLQYMVATGLLTQERFDEIMDNANA